MKIPSLSWKKLKLKTLITISKGFPNKYKPLLKDRLVSRFEIKSLESTKGLFTYLSYMDSYDLFTSSILSIHYANWLSCDILLRAQIEILLFSNWLSKNLEEVKNIFKKGVYRVNKNLDKYYKEVETDQMILFFWTLYDRLYSQKAHPLPTRYVSSLSFLRQMIPKDKDADPYEIMGKKFNKLPPESRKKKLDDFFRLGSYSPGVSSAPHVRDKQRSEHLVMVNLYLFDRISQILDDIEKKAPIYKMSDDEWERSIKKYGVSSYFPRDSP